ncbi:hypothetical protein N0V90_011370 [Kalmusia sp. IMI 367209]|nr:hypothetical protein N0V90_011370 [Kalmusia sp. IMI 367209]
MHVHALLTFLFSYFLFIASATPTATVPLEDTPTSITRFTDLDAQASPAGLPGALYYCSETNFGGPCNWVEPKVAKDCIRPLFANSSNPDATWGPKSLGPDKNGHCDLFYGPTCLRKYWVRRVDWPGLETLPIFRYVQCYAWA